MSAETENTLSKVDSAVDDPSAKKSHRRASSLSADIKTLDDLQKEGKEIKIAPETLKLNWKLNTSPALLDDKDVLKLPLTNPKVKKVDLHFEAGLKVTARNLKGVTIKDALDAIYKQFKKKADDELDLPILKGFEWNQNESWTYFMVHQQKEGAVQPSKKKKKGGDE